MAKNIVNLSVDSTTYSLRPYVVCSTAANESAKSVVYEGFSPVVGATLLVRFTNGNSKSSPTLTLESSTFTAAGLSIRYQGNLLTDSKLYTWGSNSFIEFVFDGSQWNIISISPTYDLSNYVTTSTLSSYQPLIDTTTVSGATASVSNMVPNRLYVFSGNSSGNVTSITINSVTSASAYSEYMMEFTPGSSFSFNWKPATLKWINGSAPTFTTGTKYQLSIVNNLAVWGKF